MEPSSNVSDNMLVNVSPSQGSSKVAQDRVQHCDNDRRDERRARMLARVYDYLLARAAEIEATERQSQSSGTVREIEAMNIFDDTLIKLLSC